MHAPRPHGTADLLVPIAPLGTVRRPWIVQRDNLLATLRDYMDTPRTTTAARLELLSQAVMPLAQVLVFLGTPATVAIEHAAHMLESMFLADALRDAPGLGSWFAQ